MKKPSFSKRGKSVAVVVEEESAKKEEPKPAEYSSIGELREGLERRDVETWFEAYLEVKSIKKVGGTFTTRRRSDNKIIYRAVLTFEDEGGDEMAFLCWDLAPFMGEAVDAKDFEGRLEEDQKKAIASIRDDVYLVKAKLTEKTYTQNDVPMASVKYVTKYE